MIKSMTGYGKGQTTFKKGIIIVEIRSLNHKYFDVVTRLPNNFVVFEEKARDCIKKKIRRGRVNVFVSWEIGSTENDPFVLNIELAQQYHSELLKLQKRLGLKDDLGISQIVSFPDVIVHGQKKEDVSEIWPHLNKAISLALVKLNRMRESEGKRLYQDFQRRVKKICFCLSNIESQLPKKIVKYKQNLLQKVRALSGVSMPNRDRVAEEVALFVRNSDVAEEITRIKSHLKAFQTALHSQKESGKELDFIAQELFREANTIGAKSNDFQISQWVIKIKSQIEKIREQLQNVA